jgi:hypothetical protein
MSDPFYSPRRRIARAKQHVSSVKSEFIAFFKSNPATRVTDVDPKSGFQLHKVRLSQALPDVITDLAYEAVEGLRSALDQMMHPIAIGAKIKNPSSVHFPIANDAAEVDNLLTKLTKQGIPPDIIATLRGFKTYQTGNRPIWGLNKIRRQGFHRLIVPVGALVPGIQINHASAPGFLEHVIPEWDSRNNEIILFRTLRGTSLDYNVDISFDIAFGEVEGIAGASVTDFFDEATAEVDRILTVIESEAKRLNLVVAP